MAANVEYKVLDPGEPRRVTDPDVRSAASAMLTHAAGSTPVRTGRLKAGWRLVHHGDASYELVNEVPYANVVEFGGPANPARAMLGEAVALARAKYG